LPLPRRRLSGMNSHRASKEMQISYYSSNLKDLVKYYTKSIDGLCCRLVNPCIMVQKPFVSGLGRDVWEIPRQELKICASDRLGSSRFGEVYKGLWNKKMLVAIKTLKAEAAEMEEFLKEKLVMKTLIHPKLVQLYGVCTVGKPMFIVTELMKNGALLDYLRSAEREDLTIIDLVDMAAQVAEGMAFLEKKNYIHRDLAARNVMVGEDNIVKIADFELAEAFPNGWYQAEFGKPLPIKWTAPEALTHSKYTIKSDVWSFGILLTELVTYGVMPYVGMSNIETSSFLENGGRMPCPSNCPENLYELMLQCWHKEPMKRPTFETLHNQLENLFSNDIWSQVKQ
jgi:fyn-related kinase